MPAIGTQRNGEHAIGVPFEGSQATPCVHLPKLDGTIRTARPGIAQVLAEAHGMDLICMACEGAQSLAGDNVPEFESLVSASREGVAPVATPRQAEHGAVVPAEIAQTAARGQFP